MKYTIPFFFLFFLPVLVFSADYSVDGFFRKVFVPDAEYVFVEESIGIINDYRISEIKKNPYTKNEKHFFLVPTKIDAGRYLVNLKPIKGSVSGIGLSNLKFYEIEGTNLVILTKSFGAPTYSYTYRDVILVIANPYTSNRNFFVIP